MRKEHHFCLFNLRDPDHDICEMVLEEINEEQIYSDIKGILEGVKGEETFSGKVKEYLASRKLSSKDLYERAYIDRRLLHKILRKHAYHPSKRTVFALCVAFELNYTESIELLGLASYSFMPSEKSDCIFEYFIKKRIYDLDIINDVLYQFQCPCLGE